MNRRLLNENNDGILDENDGSFDVEALCDDEIEARGIKFCAVTLGCNSGYPEAFKVRLSNVGIIRESVESIKGLFIGFLNEYDVCLLLCRDRGCGGMFVDVAVGSSGLIFVIMHAVKDIEFVDNT